MKHTLAPLLLAVALVGLALDPTPSAAQDAPPAEDAEFEPGSPAYERLERRGFFRRRAQGYGWFATRREPVFAHRRRLSGVLRAAPGIDVVERGGGASAFSRGQRCPLAVFVDGSYTTIRNVDELAVEDLAAVEVYRGAADVPIVFYAPSYDHTCGALVVWSRITLDD